MARQAKLKKMGKTTEIDESKLKRYLDPQLVVALSHSVREHILAVLNEETSSPAAVGRQLGVKATYLNYHFEELEKNGLIELVEVQPRRGSLEHFYRARKTFFLDETDWERLPETFKAGVDGYILRLIYDEVARALRADSFSARGDRHLSWMPMQVDERGWKDTVSAVNAALERVMEIQAESAERLTASDEEAIPMLVALMGFESSPETASA